MITFGICKNDITQSQTLLRTQQSIFDKHYAPIDATNDLYDEILSVIKSDFKNAKKRNISMLYTCYDPSTMIESLIKTYDNPKSNQSLGGFTCQLESLLDQTFNKERFKIELYLTILEVKNDCVYDIGYFHKTRTPKSFTEHELYNIKNLRPRRLTPADIDERLRKTLDDCSHGTYKLFSFHIRVADGDNYSYYNIDQSVSFFILPTDLFSEDLTSKRIYLYKILRAALEGETYIGKDSTNCVFASFFKLYLNKNSMNYLILENYNNDNLIAYLVKIKNSLAFYMQKDDAIKDNKHDAIDKEIAKVKKNTENLNQVFAKFKKGVATIFGFSNANDIYLQNNTQSLWTGFYGKRLQYENLNQKLRSNTELPAALLSQLKKKKEGILLKGEKIKDLKLKLTDCVDELNKIEGSIAAEKNAKEYYKKQMENQENAIRKELDRKKQRQIEYMNKLAPYADNLMSDFLKQFKKSEDAKPRSEQLEEYMQDKFNEMVGKISDIQEKCDADLESRRMLLEEQLAKQENILKQTYDKHKSYAKQYKKNIHEKIATLNGTLEEIMKSETMQADRKIQPALKAFIVCDFKW